MDDLLVAVFNQRDTDTLTQFRLAPEVFWRRMELAGQEMVVQKLGTTLAGGTEVRLRATCEGQASAGGRQRLMSCHIEAVAQNGAVVAARELPVGALLLMETKALVEALSSHHNIFLPGDRAAAALYVKGAEMPPAPEFKYVLPECDASVTAEGALLTSRAGAVISRLVDMTDEGEQRAFAVGVLGPGGVPVVTEVIVPPGAADGGKATVDFSPEDWAFAHDAVASLGAPFRILGPAHTHPYGLLSPSPTDWDLCLWSAGAEGLFLIAAMAGRQPTAAGFRWINGSLQQVDLHIEPSPEAEVLPQEEEAQSCLG